MRVSGSICSLRNLLLVWGVTSEPPGAWLQPWRYRMEAGPTGCSPPPPTMGIPFPNLLTCSHLEYNLLCQLCGYWLVGTSPTCRL